MLEAQVSTNKLSSLQALRAFAASSVVLFHAVEIATRQVSGTGEFMLLRDIAWLGSFGVDVFFVISGFIMMYAHYDDFGKAGSSRRFLVKRLIRIVPNYWLLTAVATTVLILAPQLSHFGRELDVSWVVASFFFVPWTSAAGFPWPVLGLGWTLNFEMYFYIIFAIALFMNRTIAIITICIFFMGSISLGYFIDSKAAFIVQTTHWLLAEFLLGIFIGFSFRKGKEIPNILGAAIILLCLALLILAFFMIDDGKITPVMRFSLFGIAAACLVAALTMTPLSRRIRPPKSIMLLGDASYSLYLTHVFTLPAVLLVVGRLPVSLSIWIMILLLFSMSVIFSILFYFVFERTSQRFLRSRISTNSSGRKS